MMSGAHGSDMATWNKYEVKPRMVRNKITGNQHLEADIVKQIRDILARCGARSIKIHGGNYQEAGISDLLVCLDGKFVAIEVKKPGGKMTLLQEQFQHDIRAAGGIAFVATSAEDVARELGLKVKLYPLFGRGQ